MVILLGIRLNSHIASSTNSVLNEAEDETADQVLSGCVLAPGCVPLAGCVAEAGCVLIVGWVLAAGCAVVVCVLVVGCGAGAGCVLAVTCGLVVGCALVTGGVPFDPGPLGLVLLLKGWKLC
jgi:hypothetical protein